MKINQVNADGKGLATSLLSSRGAETETSCLCLEFRTFCGFASVKKNAILNNLLLFSLGHIARHAQNTFSCRVDITSYQFLSPWK